MRLGWEWSFLRWTLVACCLSTILYVSIPDYPYGVPLWTWMTLDANGYLHEVFYITVGFLVLIDLTYRWQRPQMRVRRLRLE